MLLLCYKHLIGWFDLINKVYVSKVLHSRYRLRCILLISYSWVGYFDGDFFMGERDFDDFCRDLFIGDDDCREGDK